MNKFERDIIVKVADFAGVDIFGLLSTCVGLHALRAELTQFNTRDIYYALSNTCTQSRTFVTNCIGSGNICMRKITAAEGKRFAVWVAHGSDEICIEIAFSKNRPDEFYPFRRHMWIKRLGFAQHLALEAAFDNLLIGPREFRALADVVAAE